MLHIAAQNKKILLQKKIFGRKKITSQTKTLQNPAKTLHTNFLYLKNGHALQYS